MGDLVGRDLIGLGPIGHVGIATAPYYKMRPSYVLEAMNTIPHIQQNTIDDFKSRSKYWGSKGGLVSPQSLESFTVANRIIRQYYACPEYTFTWRWRPGAIHEDLRPISCGVFRCDTLVNYAYAFSPGYSLPTYNKVWTTPLAIYNYFPVNSDLLLHENHYTPTETEHQVVQTDSIDKINANNLKDLDSEKLYRLLEGSPNLSEDQIKSLWRVFTSNGVDENTKILFYDYISFETPRYLTNEIIQQTRKENGEARHRLLVVLQSIYQQRSGDNKKSEQQGIVNLFKELRAKNLGKGDAGIVYRGLAALTDGQIETDQANMTNMDRIHVHIINMRKNRANQRERVKGIIRNLENPDDNLVVTAGYKYLTELLVKSNLSLFTAESKQLFKDHLERRNMITDNQSMLYTSAYIEFKAALNASKTEQIPKLASNYLQQLEPELQKMTLYGFTESTKNKLKAMKLF